MKTTIFKNSTITFLILLFTITINAQDTYLKITKSDDNNNWVKYPPRTTFELTDENDKVVFSNKSSDSLYIINKPCILKVNPPYTDTDNTYYLTEGKVEIKSNAAYFKSLEKTSKTKIEKKDYVKYEYDETEFTKGLTMIKTMEPSTVNPELYNATFTFNNGIVATYLDGEMTAFQNGKALKIDGNYYIYSEDGVIGLSFSPKSGETWWYLKPLKDKKD